MDFTYSKDEFTIKLNNMDIIEHLEGMPFLLVGIGSATYRMKRGSFKIRERVSCKIQMHIKEIHKNLDEYEILFEDKTKKYFINVLFRDNENNLIVEFTKYSEGINRLWVNIFAEEQEHIYGCGENFTHFDLRGERVRIWVAEHQSLNRMLKKTLTKKIMGSSPGRIGRFKDYETYYAQPTFVSSRKYFLHVDSNAYMEFDFSNNNLHTLLIKEVPKRIILGWENSFEGLLEKLSSLLGKQPELPHWVYNGAILGIQGGTEIMMKKVQKALNKGMQISGVWCQDWEGRRVTAFGKQLMWNWEWDKKLYPNLDNVISELGAKGIRFLGYINPFLAVEGSIYKEASARGYTIRNREGKDYMVTITTFPAAMIDLTNPGAREWIKDIIKENMINLPMGGWMADFGEYLPVDAVLHSGENGEKIHNAWPALWARVNREAIEEAGKLGEIFFFTRAGYTESIKYSTLMWNGDQHVDWSVDDGLASVMPATLSLALSGFGLCHSDVGGYTTIFGMKRSRELLIRWAELCAFSPLMRSHEGNRPEDNVQFDYDEDTLKYYVRISNIYKALGPYIKAAVRENKIRGIPVMRPLFMYYDEDRAYTEKYQYLLGRDILVAPIYKEGAKDRMVYLPEDNWVHLWTGIEYSSGEYKVESDLGYPPVFYRKSTGYMDLMKEISKI